MTEENYRYRTSPFLLRNQFGGQGQFKIPIIPKFQAKKDDFKDLRLIGFDKTSPKNNNHLDRMVHFFLYDYKFERVWKNPDTDLEKLKRYRAVLTPDFSMYAEMSPVIQIYNTFRNRWIGAYYASKGLRVIPSVSWGDESTFEFCFDGIEKGSVVAVSTYMVSAHNNHSDQKAFFLKGYDEMLRQVEPEKIICYNEPFPEMKGDIVYVDYELSSWRYMNDDPNPDPYVPSKYAKYICGAEPLPRDSNIVIKSGFILPEEGYVKGMGSAHGGKWRPNPNKPNDQRFLGKPGEVKDTILSNGERVLTKIGEDGRATRERHLTDHNRAHSGHTNPHDHEITWDIERGFPKFGKDINYPDGNIPEFKGYKGVGINMNTIVQPNSSEQNRFITINDFKDCMIRGGEVEFIHKGRSYSITHPNGVIDIGEGYYMKDGIAYNVASHQECIDMIGKQYNTADEVLEYMIGGVRLRDMITKVTVTNRTI